MSKTENRKHKLIITVLSILLACSLLACALLYVKNQKILNARSSTVTDNYISPVGTTASLPAEYQTYLLSLTSPTYAVEVQPVSPRLVGYYPAVEELASTTKVVLKASDPSENIDLNFSGMLPGDERTQTFRVTIKDKTVSSVALNINIPGSVKAHAHQFMVTVKCEGTEIFSDTLLALSQESVSYPLSTGVVNKLEFDITVKMMESAGNELQNKEIATTFKWTVQESTGGGGGGSVSSSSSSPVSSSSSSSGGGGGTFPSETTSMSSSVTTSDGDVVTLKPTTSVIETEPTETSEPVETAETGTSGGYPTETTVTSTVPVVTETTTAVVTTTEISVDPGSETTEPIETTVPTETTTAVTTEPEEGCKCVLNLPWCGGERCICPWCWLIPLLLLLAGCAAVVWLVYRKEIEEKKKMISGGGGPNVGI